jgi:hypothetical protein
MAACPAGSAIRRDCRDREQLFDRLEVLHEFNPFLSCDVQGRILMPGFKKTILDEQVQVVVGVKEIQIRSIDDPGFDCALALAYGENLRGYLVFASS